MNILYQLIFILLSLAIIAISVYSLTYSNIMSEGFDVSVCTMFVTFNDIVNTPAVKGTTWFGISGIN